MWYWTVVRLRTRINGLMEHPPGKHQLCFNNIAHKVKMNETKENPFESAKKWVEENKHPGEEYVILKMFFV